MNGLAATLDAIVTDLDSLGRRHGLVGGLAVSVRTEPRLTRDADLVVSVSSDSDAERLCRQLTDLGYEIEALVEQTHAGRLATVRLRSRVDRSVLVDLLFASSGIETEITDAADLLEVLPGSFVPVATTGHLIALKLLARDDRHRPADADDLVRLAAIATDAEWSTAEDAVSLIEARGFARGRDLTTALNELRSDEKR